MSIVKYFTSAEASHSWLIQKWPSNLPNFEIFSSTKNVYRHISTIQPYQGKQVFYARVFDECWGTLTHGWYKYDQASLPNFSVFSSTKNIDIYPPYNHIREAKTFYETVLRHSHSWLIQIWPSKLTKLWDFLWHKKHRHLSTIQPCQGSQVFYAQVFEECWATLTRGWYKYDQASSPNLEIFSSTKNIDIYPPYNHVREAKSFTPKYLKNAEPLSLVVDTNMTKQAHQTLRFSLAQKT